MERNEPYVNLEQKNGNDYILSAVTLLEDNLKPDRGQGLIAGNVNSEGVRDVYMIVEDRDTSELSHNEMYHCHLELTRDIGANEQVVHVKLAKMVSSQNFDLLDGPGGGKGSYDP